MPVMVYPRRPLIERFWLRVIKTDTCWLWTGASAGNSRSNHLYGRLRDGTNYIYAHRFIYEYINGPIPKGFEIDHICNVTLCVNPEHLESKSHRDNILRSDTNPFAVKRTKRLERGYYIKNKSL